MQKPPSEFAAVIGIDWADKKHDVCLHVPGSKDFERTVIEHRVAAIEAWALGLRERFAGAPIADFTRRRSGISNEADQPFD